jgi:hypothetical protein
MWTVRWCCVVPALVLLVGCEQQSAAVPDVQAAATGTVDSPEFVEPPLTDVEIAEGWISLFDQRSLFGWQVPATSNWRVEGGEIVVDAGEKSLLLTPFQLDDFELRCDFHLSPGGNSGIFLRTADQAADPARDTYELNICDSHPTHGTGSLVGRVVAEDVPAVEGAWHSFRVLCEGLRIQVWLDGRQILDFTDKPETARRTGRLGLQMNQGRAAYRNVCVRPLRFRSLLSGSDLSGWRVVPGSKAQFAVKDGVVHVSGGAGFLESEGQYDNFVLKVSARLNKPGLNSGVFFRAMSGTEKAPSNGYELQLHNGIEGGDRSRPADSGTGAIFRRAAARYVVADDGDFLTAVLIADGDRFCSWVNGYQVVDWRDERSENENPRQGRRLQRGHFSLQGHDPGTDVDFRAVEVHEFGD